MLTFIGDVHGKFEDYAEKVSFIDNPTLQVGDMGFNYDYLKALKVDGSKHKFFGGNHDNYDTYPYEGYSLGDYGIHIAGGVKCLYIRGGFSIDQEYRIKREEKYGPLFKSWWEREQLSVQECTKALNFYKEWCKDVDIVVSHSCPQEISTRIGNPGVLKSFGFNPDTFTTRTQELLQCCFEYHQPDTWVFGHFHKQWCQRVNGTSFCCIAELDERTFG